MLTLVNSDWTGARVREQHGIDSETLYPPIYAHFRHIPWAERRPDFLTIGRISPEKNFLEIVDVLSRVRQVVDDGPHLTIVGSPDDPGYTERLKRRIEELEAKLGLFTELDALVRPDAVLATNTSALSVTEIAAAVERTLQLAAA